MRHNIGIIGVLVLLVSTALTADQCDTNYKSGGSIFRGKTYETFVDYPSLDPKVALDRLLLQLPPEGFNIDLTDESTGTIRATTKLSDKLSAPVEMSATPTETGTRVRFFITLPVGAVGNAATKAEICRYVALAQVDPAIYHTHPLVAYVRSNANSPDKVAVVESSSMKRATKIAIGGLIGAATGAAHAKLTGGDVAKESAIGAIAGGVIAFAITKIQDHRLSNRESVMQAMSYDSSQGYRAGVTEVKISPSVVKPGGTVTVATRYWALSPSSSETFGMSRFSGISYSGVYLRGFTFNPQPFQFSDGGGLYETVMDIALPAKVSPGEYTIQWVLDGQATAGDNEAVFKVAG